MSYGIDEEKSKEATHQAMKLLLVWILWIGLALSTYYAGDWYFLAFNFFNALTSFALLLSTLAVSRAWWAKSFSLICLLQIIVNAADIWADFPPFIFDGIVLSLNAIEAVLLFFVGGVMTFVGWRNESTRDSGNPAGRASRNG